MVGISRAEVFKCEEICYLNSSRNFELRHRMALSSVYYVQPYFRSLTSSQGYRKVTVFLSRFVKSFGGWTPGPNLVPRSHSVLH